MDYRQGGRIVRELYKFEEPKNPNTWHEANHLLHNLDVLPIQEIEQAIADRCQNRLFKSEGLELPSVDELVKHGKSQRNLRISQGYDIPEISDAEWAKMILRRLAVFQEALKTWGTLPTSPKEFLEKPLMPSSIEYLEKLKAKKLNHVV